MVWLKDILDELLRIRSYGHAMTTTLEAAVGLFNDYGKSSGIPRQLKELIVVKVVELATEAIQTEAALKTLSPALRIALACKAEEDWHMSSPQGKSNLLAPLPEAVRAFTCALQGIVTAAGGDGATMVSLERYDQFREMLMHLAPTQTTLLPPSFSWKKIWVEKLYYVRSLGRVLRWCLDELRMDNRSTKDATRRLFDIDEASVKLLSLRDLKEASDDLEEVLCCKPIGLTDDLLRTLQQLVAQENLIFQALVRSVKILSPGSGALKPEEVIKQVSSLLQRVVNEPEKIKYSEFKERFGNVLAGMKTERLIREVEKLREVFGSSPGRGLTDTQLIDALSVAEVATNVAALDRLLDRLQSPIRDTSEFKSVMSQIEFTRSPDDSPPLSKVAQTGKAILSVCKGLDAATLGYFRDVNVEGIDVLVNFLSRWEEREFVQRLVVLRAQVEGVDMDERILSDIEVMLLLLRPLVLVKTNKISAIAELFQAVGSLFTNPERKKDVLKSLSRVESTARHVDRLKELFGSFDSHNPVRVVFLIDLFSKSGNFDSVVPHGQVYFDGVRMTYREGFNPPSVYPDDKLDEIVRGAELSADDQDRTAVRQFLDVYKLALKFHTVRTELRRLGHPNYQPDVLPFCGVSNGVAAEAIVKECEEGLLLWKKDVKRFYGDFPRLSFIPYLQLRHILADGAKWEDAALRALPEHDNPLSVGLIGEGQRMKGMGPSQRLQFLGQQLERAGESFVERPLRVRRFGDQVELKGGATPRQLFIRVLQFFERVPHPSQILYCNPSTTRGDVEQLFSRAANFRHLKFAVVAPNKLLPNVREDVLREHNLRYVQWRSDQDKFECCDLLYLFTGREGHEAMCTTDDSRCSVETADGYSEALKESLQQHMGNSCIRQLTFVVSAERRNGKSYWVQQRCFELPDHVVVRVPVQEEFGAALVLRRMEAACRGRPAGCRIVLHFDVSFKLEVAALHLLLLDLIKLSAIMDEASGRVLCFNKGQLAVFVELPYAEGASSHSFKLFKDILPLMDVCRVVQVDSLRDSTSLLFRNPEEIDQLRLVGTFLRIWSKNKTITSEEVAQGATMTAEEGSTALRAFLCKESSNRSGDVLLVRHLAQRFQFLRELVSNNANFEKRIKFQTPLSREGLLGALFQQFIEEVRSLLQRDQSFRNGRCIVCRKSWGDPFSFESYFLSSRDGEPAWTSRMKRLGSEFVVNNWGALDAAHLRAALSSALGIERSERVVNVVERLDYVLTADFAAKLVTLNERRKVQSNVILVGDTGVGKVILSSLV